MKRKITLLLQRAIIATTLLPFMASAQMTGPGSSQSSYLVPVAPGTIFTSILSANDSINHYKMSGVPDGLGAFDNNDGTFTLLVNHEILNTLGAVRAHGSIGAFVSKWIINKQDLSVKSGSDLMQNVKLWNGTTYDTYNAANPSSLAAFSRFCSADLPSVSALYNSATGNGTAERILMNGEEVTDGRAMAHIITGPNAGTSYQLPFAGKMAFENQLACPYMSDKTIVAELEDASITNSNLYFYIGIKTGTGTEIDKAGLNNGKVYGVKIAGYPQERVSSTFINYPPAPGTRFDLVFIGPVQNLTTVQLDTASLIAGATYFSRTEDGTWDPSNPSEFYFNTTDQFDQVNDGVGTQVGHSRLWHLHFTDINHPEFGGTVEAVLGGREGQNMLDNLAIDKSDHIVDLEDVGNNSHNGKIWDYDIASDKLTLIGKHDPSRFGDLNIPATLPFNQDEETSGVIDVQSTLGPGMFLLDDQAHYTTVPADIVEGGQLLALYNSQSNSCNNYGASILQGENVTLCFGSEMPLRANGGYGFTYQWYRGDAAIIGATSATYSPDKTGNYYVVESNGNCMWPSPMSHVRVVSAPAASIQAISGLDLCGTISLTLKAVGGSGLSTYTWQKDGSTLTGITSRSIIVNEPGAYTVTITNASGCSTASAPAEVIKSCRLNNSHEEAANSMRLYPNPTSGNFIIDMNVTNCSSTDATIMVTNTLGQNIYEQRVNLSNDNLRKEIHFNQAVQEGNYFVRVIIGDKVYSEPLVYQK